MNDVVSPESRPRRRRWRPELIALCFLLPNIIGFMIFTFLPVLASAVLSFMDWDLLSAPRFIGLENYRNLLWGAWSDGAWQANDRRFWYYLYNTIFLMIGIPVGIAGSLALAILLNRKFRGRVFFRTIFFLPTMCVPVAVFLVWQWILAPDFGLMNWFLSLFGIQGPSWLGSTAWSKPSIILVTFWAGVGGYNMILYLAGLQGIPPGLYEAAEIDGAGPWAKFRHITWPMLTPTTFFITVMSVIGGFQGGFEAAYMMTRGGPTGSTTTLSYYIYNHAFEWFNMGYAAAIAWFLFALVFLVTLANWRYGGRLVHY